MATGGCKEGKCGQREGFVVLSQCFFTSALLRHEATLTLVTLAQSIRMICVTLSLDSYTRKTEHVLHMHPENTLWGPEVGSPFGRVGSGGCRQPQKKPGRSPEDRCLRQFFFFCSRWISLLNLQSPSTNNFSNFLGAFTYNCTVLYTYIILEYKM